MERSSCRGWICTIARQTSVKFPALSIGERRVCVLHHAVPDRMKLPAAGHSEAGGEILETAFSIVIGSPQRLGKSMIACRSVAVKNCSQVERNAVIVQVPSANRRDRRENACRRTVVITGSPRSTLHCQKVDSVTSVYRIVRQPTCVPAARFALVSQIVGVRAIHWLK
jgi:hypothetical protein